LPSSVVMYQVSIKGKHSRLVIEYGTADEALSGLERARRKIAFSTSKLELLKDGKKIKL